MQINHKEERMVRDGEDQHALLKTNVNTANVVFSAVSDYSVRIKTGNIKHAGTDSNIYVQVFGDKGDTGVIELKQICDTKDKFQRGMNTKINLQTVDVGNVSTCTPAISRSCCSW